MAFEVLLPRLGWNMEKGSLAEWHKRDGDKVNVGEILMSVEGDKAVQEVEAVDSGVLRIPPDTPNAGQVVPVGTLLAYLVPEEELASFVFPAAAAAPAPVAIPEAAPPVPAVVALPVAMEVPAARLPEAASVLLPVQSVPGTLAERLSYSLRTTANVTLLAEADATDLLAALAGRDLPGVTLEDFVCKFTGSALSQHPLLRSTLLPEGIGIPQGIHIAIAVATAEGTLYPVVRDVPTKGVQQLAAEAQALRAQGAALLATPQVLEGATFTIVSLGAQGVAGFTPVILPPQCAILGLGQVVTRPAAHGGQVVPRQFLTLSLTFDHRLVDGAPAARFLQAICRSIEAPYLSL